MNKLVVSMVADATTTATSDMDVAEIIKLIRTGKWRGPVEKIRMEFSRVLHQTGDVKAAKLAVDPLKKKLPGFMPSGQFNSRKKPAAEKLLTHSGLLCADLDNLGERLTEVRTKLKASPYLRYLFTSPTDNGLKAIFRVPADVAKHEASFRAVQHHVHELTGVEIDSSCSDVARLCFVSYDRDALSNPKAVEMPLLAEASQKNAPSSRSPFANAPAAPEADVRRTIAEKILGSIQWENETHGFCVCPGQHLHTTGNGERDCEIHLDGAPTVHCFHNSCSAILAGVNHELRSRIGKAEHGDNKPQTQAGQGGHLSTAPAQWFAEKFPSLADEYGDAVLEETDKAGIVTAKDIGEDFFAATLGDKGSPNTPTVFLPTEEKFYTYLPSEGIFIHQRDPVLLARLSRLLLDCARQCGDDCQTKTLEFRFRDAANLSGVLRKARGLLETPHDFFSTDLTEYIPCANGMLRLKDKTLLPFNPSYRRRNKLAVPFDPAAKCPLFLDTLMRQALDDGELDLLQRWCGLALIGENLAQRIVILTGTAGGGKGTFIRVLNGVIGQTNLASLRPHLLGERFELSRFLGKTLLYGADVPENFLNQRGASVLKSLTGYDPVTLEFKNSNESPSIICRFNVIVTCNSRLTVQLEGDTDAWRRRLAIIEYHKPKPETVIANLDQQILQREPSGVLNWMLAGLDKIHADDWQLRLTSIQQAAVDNLLLESDGHAVFARECLRRDGSKSLTVPDCFAAYVEFCNQRGWTALTKNRFGALFGDVVVRQFGVVLRHDIPDTSGKMQRGWKGLCLAGNFTEPTDKKASETSESQPGLAFSDTTDTFSLVQPEKKLVEEFA